MKADITNIADSDRIRQFRKEKGFERQITILEAATGHAVVTARFYHPGRDGASTQYACVWLSGPDRHGPDRHGRRWRVPQGVGRARIRPARRRRCAVRVDLWARRPCHVRRLRGRGARPDWQAAVLPRRRAPVRLPRFGAPAGASWRINPEERP